MSQKIQRIFIFFVLILIFWVLHFLVKSDTYTGKDSKKIVPDDAGRRVRQHSHFLLLWDGRANDPTSVSLVRR
ncbi:hypothetical protein RGU72_10195 [Undibacterium sp. 5I1]|uniref:hypothetical protein n=1 Tax=Undibacterium sp. 5I1 TaxID=3048590 RepID=UPI002AB33EE4|nr:hypothetical protein [Undibacterium sp. 5I1]MDY7538627.1 hypothetical protein [Undibacterium sp. 5I1]MEB0258129.1 hypothetical protein [Undibacterium sp. 5I1]